MAIPFSRAEGVIVILEDGSTQIESLAVEGDLIEGSLSGEIGLVHHSQSPPIDLLVRLHIVDEILREFAPDASIAGSPDGEISAHVRGTIAAPKVELTDSPSMTTNRTRARLPGGIARNGR